MNRKPNDDDEDLSYNAGGLVVFSAEYLLSRGYCCGNGCRNCPYDYKNVPEPRRTYLLKKREDEKNQENQG
ncbi:MAG TPA: DUF5522 domain-containing protein [Chitinophagaceae bacterium]